MKIIDEKGRLFGKINLIDFIVVVFLLSFIPIFYLGYKIISRRKVVVEVSKASTELELYCKVIKIKPQILKLIAVGDKEIDSSGTIIGEVTWVGESKPYKYKLDIGTKEPLRKEDLELKEVVVRLKIKTDIRGNNPYYKDKLITTNSPFNFVTNEYTLESIPIGQEDLDKAIGRMEMEISCRLVNIDTEILKLIAVGDKEIDSSGTIIGEVTWVGVTWVGEKDLELKEIPVRLRIKARVRGKNPYYKDKQVALGSTIVFETSKYTLEAVPIVEGEIKKAVELQHEVRILRTNRIDLNISFKNLTDDTIKLVSVGDEGLDEKGDIVAEILDIGKIENNRFNINLGNNNFIDVEDNSKKQIAMKLRLKVDTDEEKNLYFNNRRVEYNLPIRFKTDKYIIEGIVTEVLVKEEWVRVQVRFTAILPEIAKLIKKGDTEKKSTGSPLAIIRDVISDEPTKIQTLIVQDEKFITVSSALQRDIIANLDLLCEGKDIGLFFKGYSVKVGGVVVLTTDQYSISGTISNLEIK